ncbi:glycosyltransferase 87 family protein [Streptomyces sp. NPDC088733]|uniref:glycosyltransferase 87 family protein n=1 Tax=Streptomyces sp. NPDC088733 TaxID=3365880 RepID=UPI00381F33FC
MSAVVAVTATFVFLATVPLHRHWFDVAVYHGAINSWVHDGGALYDYLRPGTVYGFTYPPFAALCMLPMAWVDWPTTVVLAATLNIGAGLLVLQWTAGPVIRRQGWPQWYAMVLAGCLMSLLEPVRDTFTFGQVNLALLALVLLDAELLRRGSRWAGYATGLAAAVKLTPALFIGWLLIAGHRRAGLTAAATAAGATLLAVLAAPGASRTFWTQAMWDTDRVGSLSYAGNQSLRGTLARLDAPEWVWAVAVVAVLAVWAYKVRRADVTNGVAFTGVAACLISPVTWVHHLVWMIPALAVLAGEALRVRTRARVAIAVGAYVVLCSSIVWLWLDEPGQGGPGSLIGGSAYVWIALGLLLGPRHGWRSRARTGAILADRVGERAG